MKKTILFLLILTTFASCRNDAKNNTITQTGILVLTPMRNHDSFDLFIPCTINDTLSIIDNLKGISPGVAISMPQYQFQFDLLNRSWIMTHQDLNPKGPSKDYLWAVCAVEIKYREEFYDSSVTGTDYGFKLGGILIAKKVKRDAIGRTISVKKYLLPRE